MGNFQLMPNAVAVGVLSVLLTACGSGVSKPDLSTPSNPNTNTNGNSTGNNSGGNNNNNGSNSGNNNTNVGADNISTTAQLGVAIVPFPSSTQLSQGIYQPMELNTAGGQIQVSLIDSVISHYKAPADLNITYTTTCDSSVANPAVAGTDFSGATATGTLTIPQSHGDKTANITINAGANNKTLCFTITSINGKTDHQLMTQSPAGDLKATKAIVTDNAPQPLPTPPASTTSKVNKDSELTFKKLDNTGAVVADSATDWSCFKDETTGLLWETKDSTEDKDNSMANQYVWYLTSRNYGIQTVAKNWQDKYICTGLDDKCNTQAYIDKINASNLCGVNNWRLPTYHELVNIGKLDATTPQEIWPSQLIKGDNSALTTATFWTSTPMNTNIISWRGPAKLVNNGQSSYQVVSLSAKSLLDGVMFNDPTSTYSRAGIVLVSDGR